MKMQLRDRKQTSAGWPIIAMACLMIVSGCQSPSGRHLLHQTPVPRMVMVYISSSGECDHRQMGRATRANLTLLRDAGVNAIYLQGTSMTELDPRVKQEVPWWHDNVSNARIEEVGKICRELGLKLYFMPYFGTGVNHYPQVELQTSRNYKGQGTNIPSWFDPKYQEVIIDRDQALARFVKQGLADGILFEPEVYNDSSALMERGQLDFCDIAYQRFLTDMRADPKVVANLPPVAKRLEELAKSGLIGNYVEWQANDLRNFAARWATTMRKEAPGIQLGMYQPGPWCSWALRSLAQGMYDPAHGPLLILDASTYYTYPKQWVLGGEYSLKDYDVFRERVLRDWGVKAFVVNGLDPYVGGENAPKIPGYWKRGHDPEAIVAFLRESCAIGNGWWIFNENGKQETVLKHIQDSMLK